jgi:diguanylate cyclase (GGDEF)-like protein
MIDADHFKEFNDRLGHQAGDACLRAIAGAMGRRVSRPADVVARFGGEEFAVLLPDTPLEGARHVAEIIRSAVLQLAIAHPGKPSPATGDAPVAPRYVTVSIGCAALAPPPGTKSHVLVELADRALYEAKRSGRDRVCVVDPGADVYTWQPGSAMQKLRARIEAHRQQSYGPRDPTPPN